MSDAAFCLFFPSAAIGRSIANSSQLPPDPLFFLFSIPPFV